MTHIRFDGKRRLVKKEKEKELEEIGSAGMKMADLLALGEAQKNCVQTCWRLGRRNTSDSSGEL